MGQSQATTVATVHDPLEGWDADGYEPRTADVLAAEDRTSQMAAVGAVVGAAVGLAAFGGRRIRSSLLGALLGAVTGTVTGRMTRPVQ